MKIFNSIKKFIQPENSLFNIINIFYLISIILFFFNDDFFIRNLFLSFQHIFIPTGLFVFLIIKTNLSDLTYKFNNKENFFLSFFFGHIFIILLYFFLDKILILKYSFAFVYPTLFVISYFGFYLIRQKLLKIKLALIKKSDYKKNIIYVFLISVLTIFITYLINFSIFWDYPLINLYHEIHFLNAAQNFAHNKLIDNFSTASSFPLAQIYWGNLFFFYNLDPINTYINFKIVNYFINTLVIYLFFDFFIKDKKLIFYLILIFSTISHLLLSANPGDVVGIYALFLIPFYLKNINYTNSGNGLVPNSIFLFFVVVVMIIQRYLNLDFPNYFIIFIIALVSVFFLKKKFSSNFFYVLFFLITIFLVPYHRSSFLFIVCNFTILFMYLIFFNKEFLNSFYKKLIFLISFIFGIYVTLDLYLSVTRINVSINFLNLIPMSFFELLTNKKMLNVYDIGAGQIGAFFEFMKRVGIHSSILLFLFSLIIFLYYVYEYWSKKENKINVIDQNNILVLICSSSFLIFLSFNSFPYVHRAQFIFLLVILTFIGIQFSRYKNEINFRKYINISFIISLILLFLLVIEKNENAILENILNKKFSLSFNSNLTYLIYSSYLENYKLALFVIWGFLFFVIFYPRFKRYSLQLTLLQIFIIFLFSQIKTAPLKYVTPYPYKGDKENLSISHYEKDEIDLAKEIDNKIPKQKIFFSDPKTMGIYLSYSNSYSLYPFINLIIDHKSVELPFMEISRYLRKCSKSGDCNKYSFINKFNKFRNTELAEYVQVTKFFDLKKEKLKNNQIIFIINSRFLNYRNSDDDHFPNYEKLNSDEIENLKTIFKILINKNDKILICILK